MVPKLPSSPPSAALLVHTWPPTRHRVSRETDGSPPSPTSPASPHATYGGDAAAVRQSRLGQALPGERNSLRMRWCSVPQRPRRSSSRLAAHTLSIPLHPAAQPCNPLRNPSSPGSVHATHDGGGQAAKKRARIGTPQEATQHTGSDLTHGSASRVQAASYAAWPRRPQAAYPEMHFSVVLQDSSIDRTTHPSMRRSLRRLVARAGN